MTPSETSSIESKKVEPVVQNEHADPQDSETDLGGRASRKELERKLLRKLDWRLSILIVFFFLIYLDRSNVAIARLRGLERDLHLRGQQFATLLAMIYPGLILMQVPSNIFLNRIGKPSIYVPAAMIVWGALTVSMGLSTNFVSALLSRLFLGFIEASFFPGALFLLSKWYKRNELGQREGLLFSAQLIMNSFNSLVATAIVDNMDGKLGRAAWRWLFFIEGAVMFLVAVCAIFILPDFPATTYWLSAQERCLAMKRMEEDMGVSDEAETETCGWAIGLKLALKDWTVWWLAFAFISGHVGMSFMSYIPTLVATMGFNPTVTLILCFPLHLVGGIIGVFLTRHSDKTNERFWHSTIPDLVSIIGFMLAASTMNIAARYISLSLIMQTSVGYVVFTPWTINSFLRPPSKRAVALAFTGAASQLGSMTGSFIWPRQWGPTYRLSCAICIATLGCKVLICFVFKLHLARLNRKLEEDELEQGLAKKGFRYLL